MNSALWKTALLVIVCLLVACASTTPGSVPQDNVTGARGEAVNTVCFGGGLSGFREVGDRAVILKRGPGEEYLVETSHCSKLVAPEGIKIEDPGMCLSHGDHLLVFDTAFPQRGSRRDRPDRCLVTKIYRWEENRENS